MTIFMATFESIALILLIGLVGFAMIAKKIVPIQILNVLSPLVIEIALPCLVFSNILTHFQPADFPYWWTLPLWWLLGMIILMVLSATIGRWISSYRSEFSVSLLYPNGIFLPLVLIPEMFGKQSSLLVELFLFTMLFPAFLFNTYSWFFPKKRASSFQWKKFFNPILLATLFAVLLKLTHIDAWIPSVIIQVCNRIGAIAFPVIMLYIGGNVYVDFQRKGKLLYSEIIRFVLVKNLLFPAVMLGLLVWLRPPLHIAVLLFLQSVVPPVTTIPILVEREQGNVFLVNQFLVASFLVALVSIPLMMTWFAHFFPW